MAMGVKLEMLSEIIHLGWQGGNIGLYPRDKSRQDNEEKDSGGGSEIQMAMEVSGAY